MDKFLLFLCGEAVQNMCANRGIACDSLSTSNSQAVPQHTIYTQYRRSSTVYPSFISAYFSPFKIAILPLLNTSFTHFPHPLLLLQRNEN